MKLLTVIWAILMLALACFPCMDGGEAYAQDSVTSIQADDLQYDSAHNEAAHDEEPCSPLCDCNCCGGIKIGFHVPQTTEPKHSQLIAYLGTYVEPGATHPSFSFWHPPRV